MLFLTFSLKVSNKPFLISLLTSLPHLKYAATLSCNLSLIAYFLALMFHKVVWQHMQGVVGPTIKLYCKFTRESTSERLLKIGWQNFGHKFGVQFFWRTRIYDIVYRKPHAGSRTDWSLAVTKRGGAYRSLPSGRQLVIQLRWSARWSTWLSNLCISWLSKSATTLQTFSGAQLSANTTAIFIGR